MESASTSLDRLDRNSTGTRQARQARPRQRLDSASTEPRQLDSSATARAHTSYNPPPARPRTPRPGASPVHAERVPDGSRLPGTGPSVEQCREPLDRRSRPPSRLRARLLRHSHCYKAPTHNNRNINNTYDNVRPRSASHAAHLRDPAAFVVHKGFPQPAILLRMHATAASRFSLLHRLRGPSTGPWPQSIPCALSSIACISLSPGHKT